MKKAIKMLLFVMFVTPLSAAMSLEDSLEFYRGKDSVDAIEKLVSKNINAKNKDGLTPLMLAVAGDYPEIVKALIAENANLDTTFSIKSPEMTFKGTALMYAIETSDTEMIKVLEKSTSVATGTQGWRKAGKIDKN